MSSSTSAGGGCSARSVATRGSPDVSPTTRWPFRVSRADELQVVGLILHHHDRRHHGRSGRLSARRRVNQNVLPLPSSESTPMVPPCSSTRRLESARPRPVPSYRRLSLASSCTNS